MKRLLPLGVILLAIGAGVVLGCVLLAQRAQAQAAQLAPPAITGTAQHLEFALSDHHGRPLRSTDLRGRLLLVYFGFTTCPDICPTELGYLHRLLVGLGADAARVTPLFITVDPARDTVPVLADYVGLFDARLIGLTGAEDAIRAAADSVGVIYSRTDVASTVPGFYLMNHSRSTYVIGPDGALIQRLDASAPLEAAVLAIRSLMKDLP